HQDVADDRVNGKRNLGWGRRKDPVVVDHFCVLLSQLFSNTPILRNLSKRSSGSRAGLIFCVSRRPRSRYGARRSAAAFGSPCAPPAGSGTISSMTPSFFRSCAVIFIAAAASGAAAEFFHRIAAHPSGEITE